jgi:hypothetical protein
MRHRRAAECDPVKEDSDHLKSTRTCPTMQAMGTSEAARHDLYTGLVELLGENRAGTLMAYLPTYDPAEVATKSDIAALRSDLATVNAEVAALGMRMDDRFHRLTLTLVAGLFVIVAAMAGVVVAGLG